MANKNPFGKSMTQDKPYAVYKNDFGWEWRVLKTYQRPDKEPSNKYARWFVAATSPHMHDGGYELGDKDTCSQPLMNGKNITKEKYNEAA